MNLLKIAGKRTQLNLLLMSGLTGTSQTACLQALIRKICKSGEDLAKPLYSFRRNKKSKWI